MVIYIGASSLIPSIYQFLYFDLKKKKNSPSLIALSYLMLNFIPLNCLTPVAVSLRVLAFLLPGSLQSRISASPPVLNSQHTPAPFCSPPHLSLCLEKRLKIVQFLKTRSLSFTVVICRDWIHGDSCKVGGEQSRFF